MDIYSLRKKNMTQNSMKPNTLNGCILDVLCNHEIKEQQELQNIILEKYGRKIPQPTLSRRLKKLKIIKIDGMYKVIDLVQKSLPIILKMNISDSGLIVLHTLPGQASSLGAFLDNKYVNKEENPEEKKMILGTIAGDDTVLIIINNTVIPKDVLALMYQEFPYLRKKKTP